MIGSVLLSVVDTFLWKTGTIFFGGKGVENDERSTAAVLDGASTKVTLVRCFFCEVVDFVMKLRSIRYGVVVLSVRFVIVVSSIRECFLDLTFFFVVVTNSG